jgi:hypothetical protein
LSAMTDFLENKLVDHLFRNRSYAAPATIKASLYTAAPGEAGGGTEVTGGSYAPATVSTSDTAFEATQGGTPAAASNGTGGATQNGGALTFPTPTGNWGTVTHVTVDDASDNPLLYGALTNSKNVNNGDPAPSFPAGALDITFA